LRDITIAIDGPAASGKSTVGAALAKRLSFTYFDTGVMYRAVTWAALDQGISICNEKRITELAQSLHIQVVAPTLDDGRQYTVLVDSQDITWKIRKARVSQNVSPVAAYAGVRQALMVQQRRIGESGRMVMVGRDIGTVVLPQAQVKVYLDASLEERARRRLEDTIAQGEPWTIEEVIADLRQRDAIDSGRAAAPLRTAPDATIIDSTNLTVDQVVDQIEQMLQACAKC